MFTKERKIKIIAIRLYVAQSDLYWEVRGVMMKSEIFHITIESILIILQGCSDYIKQIKSTNRIVMFSFLSSVSLNTSHKKKNNKCLFILDIFLPFWLRIDLKSHFFIWERTRPSSCFTPNGVITKLKNIL